MIKLDFTSICLNQSGDDLQQRTFTRPCLADNGNPLSAALRECNILKTKFAGTLFRNARYL
jgi:hypothetical protein